MRCLPLIVLLGLAPLLVPLAAAAGQDWDPRTYRIRLPQIKGWSGELTRQEGNPLYRLTDPGTGRELRVLISINSLDSFEPNWLQRYEEVHAPEGALLDRQQLGKISGLKAYTFSYRYTPTALPDAEEVPAERQGMVIVTFANGYQYVITMEMPETHPLEDKDFKRMLRSIAIKD